VKITRSTPERGRSKVSDPGRARVRALVAVRVVALRGMVALYFG
jgi:hypothetical protein